MGFNAVLFLVALPCVQGASWSSWSWGSPSSTASAALPPAPWEKPNSVVGASSHETGYGGLPTASSQTTSTLTGSNTMMGGGTMQGTGVGNGVGSVTMTTAGAFRGNTMSSANGGVVVQQVFNPTTGSVNNMASGQQLQPGGFVPGQSNFVIRRDPMLGGVNMGSGQQQLGGNTLTAQPFLGGSNNMMAPSQPFLGGTTMTSNQQFMGSREQGLVSGRGSVFGATVTGSAGTSVVQIQGARVNNIIPVAASQQQRIFGGGGGGSDNNGCSGKGKGKGKGGGECGKGKGGKRGRVRTSSYEALSSGSQRNCLGLAAAIFGFVSLAVVSMV